MASESPNGIASQAPAPVEKTPEPQQISVSFPRGTTLSQLEEMYIVEVLEMNDGNKVKAAQELGITIKTLYNKLHEFNLFEHYQTQKKKEVNPQ